MNNAFDLKEEGGQTQCEEQQQQHVQWIQSKNESKRKTCRC